MSRSPNDTPNNSQQLSQPSAPRQSEFVGRLVLNQTTADDLGYLADFWFEAITHQIIGFSCRSGFLNRHQQFIPWTQIEAMGRDSILVSSSEAAEVEKPETAIRLARQEVWTDQGNQAGTVVDFRLDPERGDIVDYLFVSNGWKGALDGLYQLQPEDVVSMSDKRLIARDASVQSAVQVVEGLSQKAGQISDFLKDDYEQTRKDLSSVLKGTQAIASRVQQATKSLTGQNSVSLPAAEATQPGEPFPEAMESSRDAAEPPVDVPRDGGDRTPNSPPPVP